MKRRLFPLVMLAVLSVLITACGSVSCAAQAQDPEIAALTQLAQQARQRAQSVAPDAALRQLNITWGGGRSTLRFTNGAATEEISVEVPGSGVPSSQWPTTRATVTPLADGRPRTALNLAALRVAPRAAARAMEQSWPGVRVRTLTLWDDGGQLVWTVWGEIAEGAVTGEVSNATGTFQRLGPSPGPVRSPRTQ